MLPNNIANTQKIEINPVKYWFASASVLILILLGDGMYYKYILNEQKVSFFHWTPEIFILIVQVSYLFTGFGLLKNRYVIPIKLYHIVGMVITSAWFLLISARIGQGYMWILYGNAILYVFSMRKYAYSVSNQLQIAREKNWLQKNLNEKEWTWSYLQIEYKGKQETQKEREILGKLAWLQGAPHAVGVLIARYFEMDITLILGSILLYYLSMIFIKRMFEFIGMLHRLRVWETEEGKSLLLKELYVQDQA